MPSIPKREKDRPWKHKRERSATSDQALYKSSEWKRLSVFYRTINPLCEVCLVSDTLTDVTKGEHKGVTDHIIRVSDGGARYDERNLCSLCVRCHNRKSSHEGKTGFNIPSLLNDNNESIPRDRALALRFIRDIVIPGSFTIY